MEDYNLTDDIQNVADAYTPALASELESIGTEEDRIVEGTVAFDTREVEVGGKFLARYGYRTVSKVGDERPVRTLMYPKGKLTGEKESPYLIQVKAIKSSTKVGRPFSANRFSNGAPINSAAENRLSPVQFWYTRFLRGNNNGMFSTTF